MIVLDASALLAYLYDEPGAVEVDGALAANAVISSANLAEVLEKLTEDGSSPQKALDRLAEHGIVGGPLAIEQLTEHDAVVMAELRPRTRRLGLSLADRACLALGTRLNLAVMTADRAWADLDIGVEVQLIR